MPVFASLVRGRFTIAFSYWLIHWHFDQLTVFSPYFISINFNSMLKKLLVVKIGFPTFLNYRLMCCTTFNTTWKYSMGPWLLHQKKIKRVVCVDVTNDSKISPVVWSISFQIIMALCSCAYSSFTINVQWILFILCFLWPLLDIGIFLWWKATMQIFKKKTQNDNKWYPFVRFVSFDVQNGYCEKKKHLLIFMLF